MMWQSLTLWQPEIASLTLAMTPSGAKTEIASLMLAMTSVITPFYLFLKSSKILSYSLIIIEPAFVERQFDGVVNTS